MCKQRVIQTGHIVYTPILKLILADTSTKQKKLEQLWGSLSFGTVSFQFKSLMLHRVVNDALSKQDTLFRNRYLS